MFFLLLCFDVFKLKQVILYLTCFKVKTIYTLFNLKLFTVLMKDLKKPKK